MGCAHNPLIQQFKGSSNLSFNNKQLFDGAGRANKSCELLRSLPRYRLGPHSIHLFDWLLRKNFIPSNKLTPFHSFLQSNKFIPFSNCLVGLFLSALSLWRSPWRSAPITAAGSEKEESKPTSLARSTKLHFNSFSLFDGLPSLLRGKHINKSFIPFILCWSVPLGSKAATPSTSFLFSFSKRKEKSWWVDCGCFHNLLPP